MAYYWSVSGHSDELYVLQFELIFLVNTATGYSNFICFNKVRYISGT